VVSVFCAFANSITTPGAAKNYGFMVTGSKLGGMFSSGLAWYFFSRKIDLFGGPLTGTVKHQLILIFDAFMFAMIPIMIFFLMKKVPGKYLHGYEAVYKVEKHKKKKRKKRTGVFEGLRVMLKTPYVLGIFGIVFFYEILAKALGYLRLIIADSTASNVSDISSFLFKQIFVMHLVGFFISLFGTSYLLKRFGTRLCLLVIPVAMGAVLLLFVFNRNPLMIIVALTGLKSINYGFSWPVRESLYIPTVNEIKFKSKSWIDAFGSKFAKASGSTFNVLAEGMGSAMFLPIYSFFFAIIIALWFGVAYLLGHRYDRAVDNNEVIGFELDIED
jgi:AAA family ATP:ADP antiporter